MKKINFKVTVLLIACLSVVSCMDWLDVQPKTAVDEEILFEKEQGFKEALTGIYISMGKTSLYGRELTYGIIDGLAQRYRVLPNRFDYTSPLLYQFPSEMNEAKTNSIWTDGYNVIANINNLLSWIDKKGEHVIKTPEYYNIIKGEALGLRAFLHFDLLRMWGPIYKNNPQGKSIIYRTELNRKDLPLESAEQIIGKIITDLNKAEKLLENDPMNIAFPQTMSSFFTFLDFRIKRMNKYAVKALLARVYLYKGDKINAMKYAREVMNAVNGNSDTMFKQVSDNTADRVFSSELIFSINLKDFDKQVEADFVTHNWAYYCVNDKQFIYNIFDTDVDGYNDMRLREGQGFIMTTTNAVTLKYNQSNLFSPVVKNTMPLIRLPEMYYIVAECTPDLNEATDLINSVRSARGVDVTSYFQNEEQRIAAIEKEYRKEFYAEGQLWYFYKRNAYKRFKGYPSALEELHEANYRFAIPDDEAALGQIN